MDPSLIHGTSVQVHHFMDRPECWCHPHQQIRPGVLWFFVPSCFDAVPYGILLHPGVYSGSAQGCGRSSIRQVNVPHVGTPWQSPWRASALAHCYLLHALVLLVIHWLPAQAAASKLRWLLLPVGAWCPSAPCSLARCGWATQRTSTSVSPLFRCSRRAPCSGCSHRQACSHLHLALPPAHLPLPSASATRQHSS